MRSAFRQMKGSIRSFSRGNLCDCPNKQGSSRMSKIKMRCTTCGKWFQSANAKEITCPDCVQKARKEKLAAKNAPPATSKGVTASNQPKIVAPPPKPKPEQRGTNQWLDSLEDVKIAEPEPPPPPRPKTY